MTTSLDQSLSVSTTRAPSNTAEALSLADALPSVNFGFDDLRELMSKFTLRFDDYITAGRKQVLEERNQFKLTVAELQGRLLLAERWRSSS
jgi:kinetochore protein Spc25, fungi type